MNIINLFPGSWCSNCYLISSGTHAAVIDPSNSAKAILDKVKENNLTLDFIILTHGHFDHIISLDTLRDAAGVPAYIHKDDAELLSSGDKNAFKTFLSKDKIYSPADILLSDRDILMLGNEKLEIISTPGHTRGSICIKCSDKMITGDTLFADGFGRCDLYGGNSIQLRHSLEILREIEKINTQNGIKITIYPGHGSSALLKNALDNVLYL